MSPIKEDLIDAVIRVSQANLLGVGSGESSCSDAHDQDVMVWIKGNAATYRKHFETRLEAFSPHELGDFLKQLTYSTKDLGEILHDGMFFPSLKKQNTSH